MLHSETRNAHLRIVTAFASLAFLAFLPSLDEWSIFSPAAIVDLGGLGCARAGFGVAYTVEGLVMRTRRRRIESHRR